MPIVGRLKDGEMLIAGEYNERLPVITNGLVAHKYEQGFNTYELSKMFNINRRRISEMIKSSGVKLRSCSERSRMYPLNENAFGGEITEEKAYWIGFIIADGSILKTYNEYCILEIALQERDKEHLEKLMKFLDTEKPLYYNAKNKSFKLTINSSILVNDLAKYGVFPNKSLTASPPNNLPKNMYKHFWRGVIDGDGCISQYGTNGYKYYYVGLTGTEFICTGFKNFLISNGISSPSKVAKRKNTNCFSVRYGGNVISKKILELLYAECSIYLNRKYELALFIADIGGDN